MDRRTDGQTDGQTDGRTDGRKGRQAGRQADGAVSDIYRSPLISHFTVYMCMRFMYNTKFLYPCVMPLNIPDILISHFNTCSRKFIGIFLVIYDKFIGIFLVIYDKFIGIFLVIYDKFIGIFLVIYDKFIGIFLVIYDKFFQQMLTKIKKLLKHSYRNFASHSRLNNFV